MDQDENRDPEDIKAVREGLKKASEMKDPWTMWFMVRDTFNLLTMVLQDQGRIKKIVMEKTS